MEMNFSSVPVTALHACSVDDRVVLLSGQGSTLVAHESESRQILFQQRVFRSEVIHGISTPNAATKPSETGTRVLLWAGSAAALLRLSPVKEGTRDMRLESTELYVVDLCDWALFGNFLEVELWESEQAYIVTAHNEVYKIALYSHAAPKSSKKNCEKLVSGPRCVLYSAYVCSASTGLLVAAGTVFGEVVVWSANKHDTSGAWSPRTLNVLLGHKGSIFGVCISEELCVAGEYRRMLATCSDDRSIRLWNINNEAHSIVGHEHDSHSIQLSDVTGFGDFERSSEYLLAMAWGHPSRIWNIRFLPTNCSSGTNKLHLVSTGEDASIRLWQATVNGITDNHEPGLIQVREIASHTNHSGKNIWSSAYQFIGSEYFQYTGGADGLIAATELSSIVDFNVDRRNFRAQIFFDDMVYQIQVSEQRHKADTKSAKIPLKHYAIAGDGSILATTALGDLVHGMLENDNGKASWQRLHINQSKSSLLLCSDRVSGLVFVAAAGGNLLAIEAGSGEIISSSITIAPQATLMYIALTEDRDLIQRQKLSFLIPLAQECSVTLICVLMADSIRLESTARLRLPANFVPTSGLHHVQEGLLVLGSRSGSITIYDCLVDLQSAVAVFSNLHSADTITSMMFLAHGKVPEQTPARDLFILTTGRDGTYAVHELSRSSIHGRAWALRTVHRSSPPIGPNIEGAYLAKNTATKMQELMLYGFRSKDFVVWNETLQTEVLAVDCGGAHRSWAYSPLKDKVSGEAVYGGTFVWTKAGACNVYSKSEEDHHRIQLGGHGREIKAVAVSPLRIVGHKPSSIETSLVATGAEDTTIRLFAVEVNHSGMSSLTGNKMTCLRILNKHTTGIHHLEFSSCGNYLFSSGGCEEFFVWRLHTEVPVIGLGVVLECMLPKTEIDADARITSFRVRGQTKPKSGSRDEADMGFEIASAYSNGKVKIWRYSCEQGSRKGNFDTLEEMVEGSFCLTELHYDVKDEILLTAGTNGFLNVRFPWQWNLMWKQRVHQNSIQASVLVKIPGFSSTWLVITGGDDNALGLTAFCPDSVCSSRSISPFRTLLIPSAHAAAVTGLTLLSRLETNEENISLTFASVSNDQRVKVWCVTIRTVQLFKEGFEMEGIQVEKIAESWTSAADAAAIEMLPPKVPPDFQVTEVGQNPGESTHELLVVGVGMEILRIATE